MNTFLFHTVLLQLVKNLRLQEGEIGDTGVVRKDLERARMNSWTNLHTRDLLVFQTIRQPHGIPLGRLAKKVLVRDVNVRILKTLVVGQQVIDRSASLTQNRLVLQKTAYHH